MSDRRPGPPPQGHPGPPPQGHLVGRYLRLGRHEVPTPEGEPPRLVGRAPIDDHLRHPAGGLRTGALLALVDTLGGFVAGLSILPRWVVTTNLLLEVGTFEQAGPLRLDARVLRRGRHAVVAAIDVTDEGRTGPTPAAPVASAVITCTVLDPGAMVLEFERPVALEVPPPVEDPPPFEEFFPVAPAGDGATRLRFADHLRNPWGILHGGAMAALVDVAAERAAVARAPGGWACADVGLHFLQPVREGPAEARPTVLGVRPDAAVVRVDVYDVGAADRHAGHATVSLVPTPT